MARLRKYRFLTGPDTVEVMARDRIEALIKYRKYLRANNLLKRWS